MNKYIINFIFNNEENVNDIIAKVLKKELYDYMYLVFNTEDKNEL